MLKIASGSVKDIFEDDAGDLHFLFTDRVSVFDYGPIPESIPGRGEHLARFAKMVFQELKVPSLFLGDSPLGNAAIKMKKARHPKFNLDSPELVFIPLEVIFRLGVPEGSSLLKRDFKLFDLFEEPLVEFSTKLEPTDRLLTDPEAASLLPGGLNLETLQLFASDAATKLSRICSNAGLKLWDGKLEVAYQTQTRELFLLDAITPDELRLTHPEYKHTPLSKELLRRWYQKTLWPLELENAKKANRENFKQIVSSPPKLGSWRLETFANLFRELTNCLEEKNPAPVKKWIAGEKKPRVWVAGLGGRETALRWRLELEDCAIAPDALHADAVLVCNDTDLAHGLVNKLEAENAWVIGPRQAATKIEWSKIYGKHITEMAKIPMAGWTTNVEDARERAVPPVIKQDGLAAGKGVVVPQSFAEFESVVKDWTPNHRLLFEDRLQGEEASVFFWVHPTSHSFQIEFLGAAQDFKKRFAGDKGPNTGGMGAKSPHPSLTAADLEQFSKWAMGTVQALKEEGIIYSGILFLGALKDSNRGWLLLEYNARLGDPETQGLVTLWKNPNFLRSHLGLAISENLNPTLSAEHSLCIALVQKVYPASGPALKLPDWKKSETKLNYEVFESGKTSGRMAYLVVKGKSASELPPLAAKILSTCPWRNELDWREDLLK